MAILGAASLARADPPTKVQCVDANAKGQDLRRDGELSGARAQFRACAVSACPALVRDDCNRRLDEVERAQPTIVFDTKDAAGRDLSAVKVLVDGAPGGSGGSAGLDQSGSESGSSGSVASGASTGSSAGSSACAVSGSGVSAGAVFGRERGRGFGHERVRGFGRGRELGHGIDEWRHGIDEWKQCRVGVGQ
jgi:hypothetical protein